MTHAVPASPRILPRHRVLGVLALATLAGSIWAWGDEPEASRPPAASASLKHSTLARSAGAADASAGPSDAALTPLALPERFGLAVARRDLFAATASAPASAVAAPPVLAAAPVAVPAAPPALTLPFTFAGRLITAAGPSVLLNEGALTRVLSTGSALGDFRFEQDLGQQLEFVHVPSGERLVLALQP